jgi:DNA ligase 1
MTTKTFPKLFKKGSTGAMQEWSICVKTANEVDGPVPNEMHGIIVIRHGQVGGAIQESTDVVTEGKNIGKKNETSPFKQACAEAKSKWEKQLSKKGYVEDMARAEAGDNDFKGGEKVMLAEKYWDPRTRVLESGDAIVFPCDGQAKLDGHRCNAKIVDGKCSLWSRGHEPITGVPHINAALEAMFPAQTLDLDGELYNHDYRDNFEELSGFITSETPKPGHEVVEYHVYDNIISDLPWEERREWLVEMVKGRHPKIVLHKTFPIANALAAAVAFDATLNDGYEGLMLRNLKGKYIGRRSKDLQKVKIVDDAEFEVIGVLEGRGKMKGLAIFTCKTPEGVEFEAKMKGPLKSLKEYYLHPDKYIGQQLTVEYQGFYRSGKPRFPRAEAGKIRKPGF